MYIVIQHFFSQSPGSESVLITSCEPHISKGVVKPFLDRLLLIGISGNLRSLMIFVILRLIVVIAAPCFGSETQSFALGPSTINVNPC